MIKDDPQTSIENHIYCKKINEKSFSLNRDGLNQLLTTNPLEKQITKINTNLKNLTCVVDNKKNMCQHNKLHPLTAKKLKWISETMYKDIEKIIHQDSQKYITSEGENILSNHKLTNYEIEYDHVCCSDCTKYLFLVNKKMIVIKKLYNLVKALNMNDDNMENCYGVSTDFIRKLTDFFFFTHALDL